MTLPETKIRVGLAYRETILLVLAIMDSRRPTQVRFVDELKRFCHYFEKYISFPSKNIDHYPLMIRKLFKVQSLYYEQNQPVLTAKGRLAVERIISAQSDEFKRRWNAYLEFSH